MAMTREAQGTKIYILRLLVRQGYKLYAQLFQHFDLELTRRKGVVGYMIPDEMTIVLNADLHDEEYASVVVRHEILHQYLDHMNRLIAHFGGEEQYRIKNATLHDLFNIAADYEISNEGYTERDKELIRKLLVGQQELRGLVTEDEHPDWVNYTLEQLVDELMKNAPQPPENQKPKYKEVRHTEEYIDGYTKAFRDFKEGRIIYDPENQCFKDRNGNIINTASDLQENR